ncbi:putative RNA-dependent RNA polymerase 3 [Carex rostrata]
MVNDKMVQRRLEMEMDQARPQNYDNNCHSSIPQRAGPSCQRVLSPQMKALGKFEFRKAFLILSYLGRAKLEETVSMELLSYLIGMSMEAFEFLIWKEFGMKNIKPSDRRKLLDWDMDKTHVYHCYVDLQGKATFKGPFLESTKTHLQRVLGDENILQVKFEDVSQEKKTHNDFDNYYCDVYHRVAEQGIELGMRQYQFLMYKDGGKEEKKKSGTKSPVKCYFVCTSSGWDRDQNNNFHYGKTVNQIRRSFMHIHTVPSLAKYISRLSLVLSKTLKLDIDLSDPELKVVTIPDIPCKDGSTELKGIHTDGTGFISEDLALQCPIYVSKGSIQVGRDGLSPASSKRQKIFDNDGPPLLMQVRLFYKGLCAKGTLLVNRLLPKKTIQIRPSMIKVEPDPSMWGIVQKPFNSLEVVNTSTRPKKVHLSRYLIALLHFGGVPEEFFLGLLSTALAEAECSRYDRNAALKVALNNEGLDNDRLMVRMIMAGIPLDEPFLQYRLGLMMGEERKGLQAGKIPISDSYYLMGTTDPTGKLCANQVCIILDKGQLSGDVLVYKHPGLHPGDIHLLQATFVAGLESVVGDSKFAIFFPAVGPRSLADEMANSDFDGDIYWVSRHPELLKHFKPNPPWLAPEEDSSKNGAENIIPANMNDHELERLLFHSFLNNRFKPSYTVGLSAECWLVYMDRMLTPGVEREEVWPKVEKLINLYYDALDAPKTGKKVDVGKDLKVDKYPHFLEKKAHFDKALEYNSTSILGLIYDKVQSFKAEKLQLTGLPVICSALKEKRNI